MRAIVAFFVLVFSIVAILLIHRDAGLELARLLPLHGRWRGLVPSLAPVVIILITLWGISRLHRTSGSSSDSAGEPSSDAVTDWQDDESYTYASEDDD